MLIALAGLALILAVVGGVSTLSGGPLTSADDRQTAMLSTFILATAIFLTGAAIVNAIDRSKT